MSAQEAPKQKKGILRWRKPEEFKGDVPVNADGKFMSSWPTNEQCKHLMPDGTKCPKKLFVLRKQQTKFEWDEHRTGGQLIYDDKNTRLWKWCTMHTYGDPDQEPPEDYY